MARQRKNFDSPGFIEAVRQKSVPSYHTASDKTFVVPPAQPPPEETMVISPSTVKDEEPVPTNDHQKAVPEGHLELPKNLLELNLTISELDFIKSYVANNSGGQVTRKGKPIVIRESHRRMICDIYSLFGESPNMAQYIDNVLAEHFRQYYPIIQGIYRKCPPKF